ncbi:uncharacterized protein LOC110028355 [Phalaenopsis equestris]|uniref:uncharacterized protein LOC110028355 n=1 Tax=Phalaenopsis equestris TaxID=78828 RepID=UPI0009E2657D|nr:uncharacterized protein LOC110028355 [Phalaenopsis equestris]
MRFSPTLRILLPSNSSTKHPILSQFSRLYSNHVPNDAHHPKPKRYKYPEFYDPYGPRPPPPEKILQLAARIASLPPEELLQLDPALQHRLKHLRLQKISSEGLGFAAGSQSAPEKVEEKKSEKTAFNVKLEKFDAAAKIKVIKEVRAFTNLGLKEAKDLVEKVPVVLKQGITKEEAGGIIEKIKAAGGVAVME